MDVPAHPSALPGGRSVAGAGEPQASSGSFSFPSHVTLVKPS